jgi:alpha-methylacyl-CoA racemase
LEKLGLADDPLFADQTDEARWPEAHARLATLFAGRDRDDWCRLLEGTDACFAPVLGLSETSLHPHNVARGTFLTIDGVTQPAPAPRLGRTPAKVPGAVPALGSDTLAILARAGLSESEIAEAIGGTPLQ